MKQIQNRSRKRCGIRAWELDDDCDGDGLYQSREGSGMKTREEKRDQKLATRCSGITQLV